MKKLLSFLSWCFLTGFVAGAAYHVGYLEGKGDLAEWLKETNVARFVKVCDERRP